MRCKLHAELDCLMAIAVMQDPKTLPSKEFPKTFKLCGLLKDMEGSFGVKD